MLDQIPLLSRFYGKDYHCPMATRSFIDLPRANTGLTGHVKCPTLGEVPFINPLVKAPHWPGRGIVGDLIDKCISSGKPAPVLALQLSECLGGSAK